MDTNLEELISNLSEFHRKQLLSSMMKTTMFWGSKQADRLHEVEYKLDVMSAPEAPTTQESIDRMNAQRSDAEDSLVALRRLYKALANLAAE